MEYLEPDTPGDEPWWPQDDSNDTIRSEGWSGSWVQELIAKDQKKEQLGETTVTQWLGDWGVNVKLEVSWFLKQVHTVIKLTHETTPANQNLHLPPDV